jgi:NitT/TauT family transport system substrate-binding protein
MSMTRRELLKTMTAGVGAGLLGRPRRSAQAQGARVLDVHLLGFALGIHIPAMAAVAELLPAAPGYGPPKITRLNQVRLVTQTLVAAAAEIGETDLPTVLAAAEAGADLKIVGKPYDSTSLVLLVNADTVRDYPDLTKPETRVAIGARGEITHVLLLAPMLRRGLSLDRTTIVEVPGSGTRVTALLSKRIDAAHVHFDQAQELMKRGPFKVLIEPWKDFPGWINEVWAVPGAWLRKPENERVVVDLLKANITAFRRANRDLGWYVEQYRKHATTKGAKEESEDTLRNTWERLTREIKAWPNDMNYSLEAFREVLPAYKAAGAIQGTVKVEQVVETRYVTQALKELGA